MNNQEIEECLPAILAFSGIEKFADASFGSYSAGMRTRVNFAVSIFANPDLLIIDEGLAVSDVQFRRKCIDEIKRRKEQMGILLISHNMEQFEELATRIIIMERGRIVGETDDIQYGIKVATEKR